jgi:hypothetical protein
MTPTTFNGPLADDMRSYLELKRSLGMKSSGIESNLRMLDRFLLRDYLRLSTTYRLKTADHPPRGVRRLATRGNLAPDSVDLAEA